MKGSTFVSQRPVRKLAVLLHADVVGSTSLVQKHETLAHERIQDVFRRFSRTISDHGGLAHEIRGDALVAEFATASDAVSASLAFQVANVTHIELLSEDMRPVLRIGIAMGEVVVADNTVTGGGVVLAQRLEQLAEEGGICIQGAVYEMLPKRLPFDYENLGKQQVKGFDEAVRVYAVSLQPDAVIPDTESPVQPEAAASKLPVLESSTNNILTTKLEIPSARENILDRQRLFKLLGNENTRPLTLISAPAGFGKTTLMASWLEQHGLPIAWLSLDEDDNDPNRFLVHVIATISRHIAGFGDTEIKMLQGAQSPGLKGLLPSLINQINSAGQPLILVLDDYHFITHETVHETLRFFLEHRPANFYLAITSRTVPPLPLPRLRARGQLVEISENELRFIRQEAEALLNSVLLLELDPADIATLESRTEGWIAGIQLAALSLQGSTDSSQFIQTFAGNDRYIMDYLTEEVLERQSEERRDFLLRTSILERLSSKLCAQVTGMNGCNKILAGLENDHMFIVSLDNRREWYRYHHLFADLLRNQLELNYPGISGELHSKASIWYEEHGYLNDAIRHALNANNYAQAAEMIELHGMDLFHQGRTSTLMAWFKALPEEEVCRNPKRLIIYSWVLFVGSEQYVEPWLQKAGALLESEYSDSYSTTDQDMIRGNIMILRAFMAMHQGETWQTIELVEHAQRYLTDKTNSLSQTATKLLLGAAYLFTGQIDSADRTLKEAIEISLQHNSLVAYIPAVCSLMRLRTRQGLLN